MEPIYEYVRGQGWAIKLPETCTMKCGTVVRLEYRMPQLGEPWLASGGWMKDNEPIYQRFKNCLLGDWTSYNELYVDRSNYSPSTTTGYGIMTIVKL